MVCSGPDRIRFRGIESLYDFESRWTSLGTYLTVPDPRGFKLIPRRNQRGTLSLSLSRTMIGMLILAHEYSIPFSTLVKTTAAPTIHGPY